MALSIRGGSKTSMVQHLQSHKNRLGEIANELKELRDSINERQEDLDRCLGNARLTGLCAGLVALGVTGYFSGDWATTIGFGGMVGPFGSELGERYVQNNKRSKDDEEKQQMKGLLREFQDIMQRLHPVAESLRRSFHKDPDFAMKLNQMASLINEAITKIDLASSFQDVQEASGKCIYAVNQLDVLLRELKRVLSDIRSRKLKN